MELLRKTMLWHLMQLCRDESVVPWTAQFWLDSVEDRQNRSESIRMRGP